MTSKTFLTIAWDLGETEIAGPYPDKDTAQSILGENILGTSMQGAVIGPLPFEQVITDGEWGVPETQPEKSNARQWAVFEVPDGDLQWIAFGDEANLKEDFKFLWIGNYEGDCPADVYRQMNEAGDAYKPAQGNILTCVPVGVFGPTDWMRAAGDMLTKIKG